MGIRVFAGYCWVADRLQHTAIRQSSDGKLGLSPDPGTGQGRDRLRDWIGGNTLPLGREHA